MLDILIFLKNNDEVICYDVIDIFWWISIQDKIIRFDSDSTVLYILSNALFRNIPSILFKILYTFFATDSRIGKKEKKKKNIQL